MSAALKRPGVTPTPYSTPERAALAASIVAVQASAARRAGLEKAVEKANAEVRQAIVEVERCDGAIADASANAVRYLTDQALGTAGEAPQSIREARIALAEAKDHLEACRESRAILTAGLAADKNGSDLAGMRLEDAVRTVIRSETRERAAALAERVQRLQREVVEQGSALQRLAAGGVFPSTGEHGGAPTDNKVRRCLWRMDVTPASWSKPIPGEKPFAEPTGSQRWAAAFEALKIDASTPLPEDI